MSPIIETQVLMSRLRALRKAEGLSVQAVADRTGIPRAVLAKIDLGQRQGVTLDEASKICDALGVDLRVVLSDEPMPVATKVWVI